MLNYVAETDIFGSHLQLKFIFIVTVVFKNLYVMLTLEIMIIKFYPFNKV